MRYQSRAAASRSPLHDEQAFCSTHNLKHPRYAFAGGRWHTNPCPQCARAAYAAGERAKLAEGGANG